MQTGKLDQRITLQSKAETNVSGQLNESWQTVEDVWARVITQRGSEAFESARINARETIRVQIRYRDDVTAKWRIVWNGQNYSIVAPPDKSMRRKGELWLTAQAVGIV